MEMIRHLSDEELDDLLLNSDEHCLRPALQLMSEEVRTATAKPEEFWEKQEKAILSRTWGAEKERQTGWLPAMTWAAAVAAIAVSALFFTVRSRPVTPGAQSQQQVYDDRELLVHVEEVVQSGGPEALEPAAMLAAEISEHASLKRTSTTTKKESTDEN